MKKFMFTLMFVMTLSSSAMAFAPQLEFYVNREVAVSRVWNNTFRPIVCSGQAFGRTYSGVVLNSWVNQIVIYPNTYVEVYVHSNFYDPMLQAWAQIDCQIPW
jgi:hypothetical protein